MVIAPGVALGDSASLRRPIVGRGLAGLRRPVVFE
jgi:hypothetical protein